MGLRGKRGKDKKSTGWYRDVILGLYTYDQAKADWEAITPAERVKLVGAWVPKELNNNGNNGLQINLILTGIEGKRVIQVQPIEQNALVEHETE